MGHEPEVITENSWCSRKLLFSNPKKNEKKSKFFKIFAFFLKNFDQKLVLGLKFCVEILRIFEN